jgi:adenosylhomocysteine nucleosidase
LKILVTFALHNEFASWRKLRQFRRAGVFAPEALYQAVFSGVDVRVVLTGVGEFSGRQILLRALDDGPDVCISSGLAGGLKPNFSVGQVLVARNVTDSNRGRHLSCDPELVALASENGARVVDTFLSSDHVVARAEEKQKLASLADAVDMESVNILSVAKKKGIGAVAIRALSDTTASDLPLDFDNVFDGRGNVNVFKVAGQLAAHPGRIPGLIRLAQDSERAAGALAQFLDSYVIALGSGPLDEIAKADAIAL